MAKKPTQSSDAAEKAAAQRLREQETLRANSMMATQIAARRRGILDAAGLDEDGKPKKAKKK